jgi:hypothetical protein
MYPANVGYKEFGVAFSPALSKLTTMDFVAYSYYWRFTYRTHRKRGAAV